MVMMRLACGTVELSTIQTLCLLSMLEFTGKVTTARALVSIPNIVFHLFSGSYHSRRVLYHTGHIFDEKPPNKWSGIPEQFGN